MGVFAFRVRTCENEMQMAARPSLTVEETETCDDATNTNTNTGTGIRKSRERDGKRAGALCHVAIRTV